MKKPYTFVVYKDKSSQFRWRILAGNNKIIADSAEAYTRKDSAFDAVKNVVQGIRELVEVKYKNLQKKKK